MEDPSSGPHLNVTTQSPTPSTITWGRVALQRSNLAGHTQSIAEGKTTGGKKTLENSLEYKGILLLTDHELRGHRGWVWEAVRSLRLGQTRGKRRAVCEWDSGQKESSKSVAFLVTKLKEGTGYDGILLFVFQGEVDNS